MLRISSNGIKKKGKNWQADKTIIYTFLNSIFSSSSSVRLLFQSCVHCKWNHSLQVSHATHFTSPQKSAAVTLQVLDPKELSKFLAKVLRELGFRRQVSFRSDCIFFLFFRCCHSVFTFCFFLPEFSGNDNASSDERLNGNGLRFDLFFVLVVRFGILNNSFLAAEDDFIFWQIYLILFLRISCSLITVCFTASHAE